MRADRTTAAVLGAGAVAGCALVAAVDPGDGGPYPRCPSQLLFGIDCPACGTLRGIHALASGDLLTALDHNVLLLAAVPLAALVWWGWVRTAAGRQPRTLRAPTWALPASIAVALLFTVARNLPHDALRWLDSAA